MGCILSGWRQVQSKVLTTFLGMKGNWNCYCVIMQCAMYNSFAQDMNDLFNWTTSNQNQLWFFASFSYNQKSNSDLEKWVWVLEWWLKVEGMSVGKSNCENAMKKYEKILKNFFGEVFQREKVWLGKRKHAWNSTEDLKKKYVQESFFIMKVL